MIASRVSPQATTFVGRTGELADIARLLDDPACRLLTLVGPGGIGKTRLALEAAQQITLPHGTCTAYLQPLTAPEFMPSAIADALGIQFYPGKTPQQQLLDYLHDKSLLLVLDNLEHLLDGVDLLAEMLNAAPGVRLLATSRERLNLREEWVLEVGGLPYPAQETEIAIEGYSAVALFVQHARQVNVGFTLTEFNQAAVIRICRLVGGMPLALELAAAWVRVLSCEAIAAEIGRSLDILESPARNSEPRHRTMRAALEPTWERLTDDERGAFMRLSVFRGGFTRAAAEIVAGASLRILSALVDKSLLRADSNGRYDLHELLRQHGEEQLSASGAGTSVRDAHSAFYADFMRQRVEDLKGRRQLAAIAEIHTDFENVRAAWHWAAAHIDKDAIERMIDGLRLFCKLRNRESEGCAMFAYAAQQFAPAGESHSRRLWGRLLARGDDRSDAFDIDIEMALHIARENGDDAEMAFCLKRIGVAAHYLERDYKKAKQFLEQSLTLYQQLGDQYAIASVLHYLMAAGYEGTWDDFYHFGTESLRLRRAIGDYVGVAQSLYVVADGEAREGHFAEAERLYLERIELAYEVGNIGIIALSKAHLSYQVYFMLGDFSSARAAAAAALDMPASVSSLSVFGWSLCVFGLLANMEEDYLEAVRLCRQAISMEGVVYIIDFAAWGMAMAACGLGDYAAARGSLGRSLRYMTHFRGLVGMIACLPVAAIILAHEAHAARAVELLALAFTHPAQAAGWMAKWPLLGRLRAELKQMLGAEAYAAAWDRGAQLDIDTVIADLYKQFPAVNPVADDKPVQPFVEPLTARELDVLILINEGLTNQEIAERLVVGVSTVKKHINHIYDKLGVKNRTSAAARARDLKLV